MSGVFRSTPSLPQAPQAPALGALSKAAAAPVAPVAPQRADIGVIHASQYGFGHKRRKRKRLPTPEELGRVVTVVVLADRHRRKRAA